MSLAEKNKPLTFFNIFAILTLLTSKQHFYYDLMEDSYETASYFIAMRADVHRCGDGVRCARTRAAPAA